MKKPIRAAFVTFAVPLFVFANTLFAEGYAFNETVPDVRSRSTTAIARVTRGRILPGIAGITIGRLELMEFSIRYTRR